MSQVTFYATETKTLTVIRRSMKGFETSYQPFGGLSLRLVGLKRLQKCSSLGEWHVQRTVVIRSVLAIAATKMRTIVWRRPMGWCCWYKQLGAKAQWRKGSKRLNVIGRQRETIKILRLMIRVGKTWMAGAGSNKVWRWFIGKTTIWYSRLLKLSFTL